MSGSNVWRAGMKKSASSTPMRVTPTKARKDIRPNQLVRAVRVSVSMRSMAALWSSEVAGLDFFGLAAARNRLRLFEPGEVELLMGLQFVS